MLMADDLDKQLEDWYNSVVNVTNLSATDKGKVTGAGAAVFADKLKVKTPMSSEKYDKFGRSTGHNNAKHGKKPRKTKHLRESITFVPGKSVDGVASGNTLVGFDSKYQAMVARFVNNGTAGMSPKEVKNMHFMEGAELDAKSEVLKAEAQAFKKVTGL
ncbi:phage tail protein [Lactobacillus sp. ESL0230]|nr:phage tail protein [Lactobacillus sp. ESL0230]